MDKVTIKVMDVVPGTTTNADALPLYMSMKNVIAEDKIVVLSLSNATGMSSSFLNSSLGNLVEDYGFETLKGRLKLVDYTPVMLDSIKRYLDNIKSFSHK